MSYIGKIGAARLDPGSNLGIEQAEQMSKEGYDPIVIKVQTGWEMGVDGKWRYELPDPFWETAVIESYVKPRFGEPINIKSVMRDTRLLEAYPELADLALFVMYSPRKGTAGYYSPATNGMVISMGTPSDKFEYQIDGVLLHEIQHLIQPIEGFAVGGNPKASRHAPYICVWPARSRLAISACATSLRKKIGAGRLEPIHKMCPTANRL